MLHWPSAAWGAAHLSKREFDEWAEFYKLEPFGPSCEDRRAGVIASMLSSNAKPETFFCNLAEDARDSLRPKLGRRPRTTDGTGENPTLPPTWAANMADMGKLALQMSLNPGTFEQDIKRSIAQVQSRGPNRRALG